MSKYQDGVLEGSLGSIEHTPPPTPGGKHNNKIQLLGPRRFLLLLSLLSLSTPCTKVS
jgi:hypothetical protein